MRLRDRLALTAEQEVLLVRALQVGMALVVLAGILEGNGGVVINAGIGLAVTFVPALLRRNFQVTMDVALVLWIAVAMFAHSLGVLVVPRTGLNVYTTVGWWDHLTHTLSASLVAAVGYATARAFEASDPDVHLPPRFLFAYLLLFTMAFGVAWELMEFLTSVVADRLGVPGILTQYGLDDTIVDLVFDTAGAVVVAIVGTAHLSDLVDQLSARLEARTGD